MVRTAAALAAALVTAALVVVPATRAQTGQVGVQLVSQLPLTYDGGTRYYFVDRDLRLVGSRAYVLREFDDRYSTHFTHHSLLEVVDIAGEPRPLGTFSFGSARATDLVVDGATAYVSTGPDEGTMMVGGLRIVDLSDPANGRQVGAVTVSGSRVSWVASVAVGFGYAYLVGDLLTIVDVSNPSAPTVVAQPTQGGADVQLRGSNLYVATGGGLQVYDLTNPRQPVPVGVYAATDGGSSRSLALAGDRAYLARRTPGAGPADVRGELVVLDVATPTAPRFLGRVPLPAAPANVQADGTTVYAALGDAGLAVVDAADPAQPRVVTQTFALARVGEAAVANGQLYAANGPGLAVARYPAAISRLLLPWSEQSGNPWPYPPP